MADYSRVETKRPRRAASVLISMAIEIQRRWFASVIGKGSRQALVSLMNERGFHLRPCIKMRCGQSVSGGWVRWPMAGPTRTYWPLQFQVSTSCCQPSRDKTENQPVLFLARRRQSLPTNPVPVPGTQLPTGFLSTPNSVSSYSRQQRERRGLCWRRRCPYRSSPLFIPAPNEFANWIASGQQPTKSVLSFVANSANPNIPIIIITSNIQ